MRRTQLAPAFDLLPVVCSGHGGHLSHMAAWFTGSSTLCPTGCMHVCHLEVGGGGGGER
jgi:hypothetical protein